MAIKTEVNFSCGHTATVGLRGTPEEIQARVKKLEKKGLCPDCMTKQKNNKKTEKEINKYPTPNVGPYESEKKPVKDPVPDKDLSKTCLRIFIKESKYKKFFSDCKTEKSVAYPDSGKIYVYVPYERMMAILAKKMLDENPGMIDRKPFLDGAACYAVLFGKKSGKNEIKEEKIATSKKPAPEKAIPAKEKNIDKKTEKEENITEDKKIISKAPEAENKKDEEIDDFFKEIGYDTGIDDDISDFINKLNDIDDNKSAGDITAEKFIPVKVDKNPDKEAELGEPEEVKLDIIDTFTDSVLGIDSEPKEAASSDNNVPSVDSDAPSDDSGSEENTDDDFDPYDDF